MPLPMVLPILTLVLLLTSSTTHASSSSSSSSSSSFNPTEPCPFTERFHLAQLGPPVLSRDDARFAHTTLHTRLPDVARRLVAELAATSSGLSVEESSQASQALEALIAEIPDGALPCALTDELPVLRAFEAEVEAARDAVDAAPPSDEPEEPPLADPTADPVEPPAPVQLPAEALSIREHFLEWRLFLASALLARGFPVDEAHPYLPFFRALSSRADWLGPPETDAMVRQHAFAAAPGTCLLRGKLSDDPWDSTALDNASWLTLAPGILSEMLWYRRVLEASGYFINHRDPWAQQKQQLLEATGPASAGQAATVLRSFESSFQAFSQRYSDSPWQAKPHDQRTIFSQGEPEYETHRAFDILLKLSLWGNSGDPSLHPLDEAKAAPSELLDVDSIEAFLLQRDEKIVSDSTEDANYALFKLAGHGNRIDFILDNVGAELINDLALAVAMLRTSVAARIVLHTKWHPTFVSDATTDDVHHTIQWLKEHERDDLRWLAARIEERIADGSLVIRAHQFWNAPRMFYHMPLSLVTDMTKAALVIIKGDANYRRLVGDRHYPPSTHLDTVTSYWVHYPVNRQGGRPQRQHLVALRVCKADTIIGIDLSAAEALDAEDRLWSSRGTHGVIQTTFHEHNTDAFHGRYRVHDEL